MKPILIFVTVAAMALALFAGCHNTGRQVRKSVDGVHDLLLEGSY
ncbi:MAG: hypothetical protein NT045_03645 [Candidatus Aureabacteria bacterium]|nr:hypothetical protein [Candidatus Auribacterota bacterium]